MTITVNQHSPDTSNMVMPNGDDDSKNNHSNVEEELEVVLQLLRQAFDEYSLGKGGSEAKRITASTDSVGDPEAGQKTDNKLSAADKQEALDLLQHFQAHAGGNKVLALELYNEWQMGQILSPTDSHGMDEQRLTRLNELLKQAGLDPLPQNFTPSDLKERKDGLADYEPSVNW